MADTTNKSEIPLLPNWMFTFFRTLTNRLIGIGLLCLTFAYWFSLGSYDSNDAGFNIVTDIPPQNVLSYLGSYLADFIFQTVGIAGWILGLIGLGWSWRFLSNSIAGSVPSRLVAGIVSILLAAFSLGLIEAIFPILPLHNAHPTQSFGGLAGVAAQYSGWQLQAYMDGFYFQAPFLSVFTPFIIVGLVLTILLSIGIFVGLYHAIALQRQEWHNLARVLGKSMIVFLFIKKQVDQWITGRKATKATNALTAISATDNDLDSDHEDFVPQLQIKKGLHTTQEPDLSDGTAIAEPEGRIKPRQDSAPAASVKKQMKKRQTKMNFDTDIYQLPSLDLLDLPPPRPSQTEDMEHNLEQNARALEMILQDFGVKGNIVEVCPGPVVTLYAFEPAPGIKASRVIGLAEDVARSMSALSVRIATVPGRNVIGIELPNAVREMVPFYELVDSSDFTKSKAALPLILGKDIAGKPQVMDLATMPHLLIAGTTGSGKSVGLNAMILSLLYRYPPENCRFIMIDPKMLELSVYNDIPHLLTPVVTDPKKAVVALKWCVREMENRYRAIAKLGGVRNIDSYNKKVQKSIADGETITRKVTTGIDPETRTPIFEEQELTLEPLPYIVVVVDEMADLMLVAGKEIEASIQRLAQMARAAGIHIIMATQRPSVDVITGTIKANFPTRVSFAVTSKVDARTVMGEQGAEQLLGKGDMLVKSSGGRIARIHGPFVEDSDVEKVCDFIRSQGEPDYISSVTDEADTEGGFDTDVSGASNFDFMKDDQGQEQEVSLYDQAVAFVAQQGRCSTSLLQRQFKIGYNRAADLVDRMEQEGIISAPSHNGKREVLVGEHRKI